MKIYEALHHRLCIYRIERVVDKLENPFVTANVDKTAKFMPGTTYNNSLKNNFSQEFF